MNRKEAAELLPIIQAFAEGRDIEYRSKGFNENWKKVTQIPELSFKSFEYRIKPESKYRPFANTEECWNEMLKHQPFGVVKDKHFANYQTHRAFTFLTNEGCNFRGYEDMTPFGIKVEE